MITAEVREMLSGLNTLYPGRIVEFDSKSQTATIQLVLEGLFSNLEKNFEVKASPVLTDVPCHFPKGGEHSITMPVTKGDDCLVFFCQRGIQHWLYEGAEEAGLLEGRPSPQHIRMHSKTDAMALIGFGSGILAQEPKVIKDFNTDAIELRNKDRTQRVSLEVASGNIDVETFADISVKADGKLDATIGGDTTITTPKVILNADVQVNGRLDATGVVSSDTDCLSAGKSGKSHKHAHGNPNTSPPL